MDLTEAPNTMVAPAAATGREFWIDEPKNLEVTDPRCGKVNRGLAISGDALYAGTLDGKLISLDAAKGRLQWETVVVDFRRRRALTHAPLVIRDKELVGTAGGELGIRASLAAYDTQTGKEVWRFKTIPEPGHESWSGESWKHGGGPIWLTGSDDPGLNLKHWGVGNPGSDWNPRVRPCDSLHASSAMALDADTGQRKWHFQFSPHDEWDWGAEQTPLLVDREWQGWPIRAEGRGRSPQGTRTFPGVQGGTNWFATTDRRRPCSPRGIRSWHRVSGTWAVG